jgi:hypothetical protein
MEKQKRKQYFETLGWPPLFPRLLESGFFCFSNVVLFLLFSQTNLALHADDVANGVVYIYIHNIIYISQTTTSPSQPQKITL